MMYYIDTIEQVKTDTEGVYNEYGGREKVADQNLALSKYYTKLSNVAADLGKAHTYMNIKLVNSLGGVLKSDAIGTYEGEEPAPVEG